MPSGVTRHTFRNLDIGGDLDITGTLSTDEILDSGGNTILSADGAGNIDGLGPVTDANGVRCKLLSSIAGALETFEIRGAGIRSIFTHGGTECLRLLGEPADIFFLVDTRWSGVFTIFCDDALKSVLEWNNAGEVTKIGQDVPVAGQQLEHDGTKCIWDTA